MSKVSVVIPCFNDGKYIDDCISSVKKQTYKNIEVIIIDDGSTDQNTKQILNQKAQEENVTLIKTGVNKGPAFARNKGINISSGKYILPLDADDKIAPEYIEKAVSILDNNNNIGIVYSKALLFGAKSGVWDLPPYNFHEFLIQNMIFVSSLFRKDDWEKLNGFKENMVDGLEDYDFWIGIHSLKKEVHQIDEYLFYYRIRENSKTHIFKNNYESVKKAYSKIYDNHKDFFKEHIETIIPALRSAWLEERQKRYIIQNKNILYNIINLFPNIKKNIKKIIIGS